MQPKELEGQNIGVYAIPGVSSGIGAKAKELLLQRGHEVINIDLKDGDICVNLATAEGRQKAVNELHRMCPDGLDRISAMQAYLEHRAA